MTRSMFHKNCTWFGEKKNGEIGCTCDRPRSGRPPVLADVAVEVHNEITGDLLHTARMLHAVYMYRK